MILSDNILELEKFNISTKVDAYGAYVIFMSVNCHFKNKSKFNIKHSFLKNIKEDKISTKNKIYYTLNNISKRYNSLDLILIFVENQLTDNIPLLDIDYETSLLKIKRRLSTSNHIILNDFKNILKYCDKNNTKFKEFLQGDLILKMYSRGYIFPETVLALHNLFKILNNKTEDLLLIDICDKLLNYKKIFLFNNVVIKEHLLLAKNVYNNEKM